ncbi:hypothetical protein KIPE111705_33415 [Kibdelosporangium persicum]|uniref:hypothetical protein n=1 Tax=Kibdelosporangium persicum TaxID=2698649 RepID=UPI00156777E3|nr:hypothetical protein [Kibdelosporangium persicum]
MSTPEIDPQTARSMEEDSDFAEEHTKPTYADEDPQGEDESVPDGLSGMDPA